MGDSFLRDTLRTFQAMNRQAKISQIPAPYVYNRYNIVPMNFHQNGNILARIINNLIEGFNSVQKMPRMIMVIPDGDIVHAIKHKEFGFSKIVGRSINYLSTQIERAIQAKKDSMMKLKPGAITVGEPKIMWVSMLNRYFNEEIAKEKDKFNAILEENISSRESTYIIKNFDGVSKNSFASNDQLTASGRMSYWMTIDSQIQEFDLQKISLKPRPVISEAEEKKKKLKAENKEIKKKLPTPPPFRGYQDEIPNNNREFKRSYSTKFNHRFNRFRYYSNFQNQ